MSAFRSKNHETEKTVFTLTRPAPIESFLEKKKRTWHLLSGFEVYSLVAGELEAETGVSTAFFIEKFAAMGLDKS